MSVSVRGLHSAAPGSLFRSADSVARQPRLTCLRFRLISGLERTDGTAGGLDHAAEKGGFEELFAALKAAVEADSQGVPPPGERECAGLRGPRADRSPSSTRPGEPSRQDDWRVAFVAALAAEVDALIGPGSVGAQDFEALEQALRREVLGLAAQAMAQYFNADETEVVSVFRTTG